MNNVTRSCEQCGEDFSPKMKRSRFCSKPCGDASYYAANKEQVRTKQSSYYKENSDRFKQKALRYHEENREHRIEQMRSYRAENLDRERDRRSANAEKIKAQKREWNLANRDRIREQRREYRTKNAEVLRRQYKQWMSANLARFRVYNHERRARVLASTYVPFTQQQLEQRIAAFGGLCWMCGADGPTIDHVKPLHAGGPHMLANLRPACKSCNSSKGSRWYGVKSIAKFMLL